MAGKWVLEVDIRNFFDRVNHHRLMAQLAKRITDKRVLRFTRAFLNAGVMEDGLVEATYEGTPQGGSAMPRRPAKAMNSSTWIL